MIEKTSMSPALRLHPNTGWNLNPFGTSCLALTVTCCSRNRDIWLPFVSTNAPSTRFGGMRTLLSIFPGSYFLTEPIFFYRWFVIWCEENALPVLWTYVTSPYRTVQCPFKKMPNGWMRAKQPLLVRFFYLLGKIWGFQISTGNIEIFVKTDQEFHHRCVHYHFSSLLMVMWSFKAHLVEGAILFILVERMFFNFGF